MKGWVKENCKMGSGMGNCMKSWGKGHCMMNLVQSSHWLALKIGREISRYLIPKNSFLKNWSQYHPSYPTINSYNTLQFYKII